MKRVFFFAAVMSLLGLFSCQKLELSTKYVNTLNATVNAHEVMLSGFLDSDVDLSSVSKVYFLVSKNAKVPERGSLVVDGTLDGMSFTGTAVDLEYAQTYYFKAAVTIGKKSYAGKAVKFVTEPLAVSYVEVLNSPISLLVGQTAKVEYKIYPENATNQKVTFSSNYDWYAAVSEDGTVTAKSAGTCRITVRTEDGGKTDDCTVNVRSVCPADAADLGLSVYWGRWNVNASADIELGTAFCYPTQAYSSQILETYGGSKTIYDFVDPGWEAPSRDQVQELFGNCTAAKSTRDGVSGVHLTSKSNGRSIFIPNGTYYTRTKTGTETHTTSSIYGPGGYHWDYYAFTIAEGKCSWSSQCGKNTSYVRLVLL